VSPGSAWIIPAILTSLRSRSTGDYRRASRDLERSENSADGRKIAFENIAGGMSSLIDVVSPDSASLSYVPDALCLWPHT